MSGKIASLRKRAKEKRSRADKLWRDAPSVRVDRFKKPYFDVVKKLYEDADKLDREADRLVRGRRKER